MGLYSDPTFSDPTTASFDYDTMGNMTYDGENSLHYSYNYLNLPNKVTRQDTTGSAATELILVKYKYLWDGTKVRAVNAEGVGYEYMGSLRFTVDGDAVEVESIPFSGGRILRTSAGYEPKYYVTDHLGSTRAIVNQDGKTVEAIFDYMPYGTEHTYASSPTAGTDYRFTGKERQDFFNMEDIYDSQARFQSTSGRFLTIDPLAEVDYSTSPYVYCAGNPVRNTDLNGLKWENPEDENHSKYLHALARTKAAELQRAKTREEQRKKKIEGDKKLSAEQKENKLKKSSARMDELDWEIRLVDKFIGGLDKLGSDEETTYTFHIFPGQETYELGSKEDGTIVINSNGSPGSMSHETAHAIQYANGELSLVTPGGTDFLFSSREAIETEAYGVQLLIGGRESMPRSSRGGYPSKLSDITLRWVGGLLQEKTGQPVYGDLYHKYK